MSRLEQFLKANKRVREPVEFAASRDFIGEDGNPVPWKIRPISTLENEAIRDQCYRTTPADPYPQLDLNLYTAKLLAASVIEPNLYDKQLQDSYGVMTPEDLIRQMIDNPADYQRFADFIQSFNGFDQSFDDKVEISKN